MPIAGVFLLLTRMPLGWALLGLSVIPMMILSWRKGELRHVPTGKTDGLHDILSSDVLGRLPSKPTPRDIIHAISQVPGGQFFAARFGITPNFLTNITTDDTADTTEVWKQALWVQERTGSEHVSGAVLAVALTRQFTGHEHLINLMHLEMTDLLQGIAWYEHIRTLIRQHKSPRRTGGIARDWAFGYTPMLDRFGRNISEQVLNDLSAVDLESHQQAVQGLIETFSTNGRQNAVLVGAPGAGKSTVVRAFAERLLDATSPLPHSLKFRQVYMLDSSALIATAPGRGELEGLIMKIIGEAFSAKNIIICLDDAQLFFEEGVGSVDLANVLQPILESGRLRLILTMDEQRLLQIARRNSSLVNVLNRINIEPATADETIRVMQDKLIVTEYQKNVIYTYQSLHDAYALSKRYVHDLEMPGRAVKLMEASASFPEGQLVTANSVHKAVEQAYGVKVGTVHRDDNEERETLINLEDLIHKRMINQSRAVSVVSDALRRARTGVRNQNRPIGTFLFLGPTGVGKTELAKALADVYFKGEDKIIRIDFNEYVTNDDVARLIADGADNPMSLTAQLIKQPFSVVLLDEIEKAHPNVLTTLLQALDEGVLRDVKNREVSFRDAIVIATSNAGAERIREYIERGYKLEQFEAQFTDELVSSGQFKPEFLNRFDEIVVFRPLEKPELIQVIDLILDGVNKTLAPQKVSVLVDDDAKQLLVDKGYDPRLGARPMRRIVQRTVENTVAKQMLAGSAMPGSVVRITADQIRQLLDTTRSADQLVVEAQPASDDMSRDSM